MTTALTIANDILKIAKRKNISLTPMQLVKLVYISYGWHLAMTGKELFGDRIEAWKYGPMIPKLYHATKQFGRQEIPHRLISDTPISDPDLESFLTGIVENYGIYSGISLSNLTHREGTPWHRTYRPGVLGLEIPKEYIREHYQQRLEENEKEDKATNSLESVGGG